MAVTVKTVVDVRNEMNAAEIQFAAPKGCRAFCRQRQIIRRRCPNIRAKKLTVVTIPRDGKSRRALYFDVLLRVDFQFVDVQVAI